MINYKCFNLGVHQVCMDLHLHLRHLDFSLDYKCHYAKFGAGTIPIPDHSKESYLSLNLCFQTLSHPNILLKFTIEN
jgi:hypothetical protein